VGPPLTLHTDKTLKKRTPALDAKPVGALKGQDRGGGVIVAHITQTDQKEKESGRAERAWDDANDKLSFAFIEEGCGETGRLLTEAKAALGHGQDQGPASS
jgi:hypothetical protein